MLALRVDFGRVIRSVTDSVLSLVWHILSLNWHSLTLLWRASSQFGLVVFCVCVGIFFFLIELVFGAVVV